MAKGRSEFSVREAAALLGKSERTVRRMIREEELPAERTDRGWRVRLADLRPLLLEMQGAGVGLDGLRREIVEALAPAETPRRDVCSMHQVCAFEACLDVYRRLPGATASADDRGDVARAGEQLGTALEAIAEGCHTWGAAGKREAFGRARALVARGAARLEIAALGPGGEGCSELAHELEERVLPSLGGLLRHLERRR